MIHFVIGTRAQLFKMTPIMLECEERGLEWRWVYVAQHKETFEQTLRFFGLPDAHYTVVDWKTEASTILKGLYWLSQVASNVFRGKKILDGKVGKDHIVLTHGDTITTVFGALIGKLTGTPVMHVEAGLRSFNLFNPFPEEINRLITFRLSDYYACPGQWACDNLEKFNGRKINTFQNTQMDVLRFGLKNIDKATIELPTQKYTVLSSHRFENLYNKERLEKIIEIAEYASKEYKVIIPQHPVTKGQIEKQGFKKRLESNENIIMMPRLEYENYLKAIVNAEFVLTDGGGNQEELYHLGKPTLILRNETERKEGLDETALISKLNLATSKEFIDNYHKYEREPVSDETYPSKIIVDEIADYGQA